MVAVYFFKRQTIHVKMPIFFFIMAIFPFLLNYYLPVVFRYFKHQKIDYSYCGKCNQLISKDESMNWGDDLMQMELKANK